MKTSNLLSTFLILPMLLIYTASYAEENGKYQIKLKHRSFTPLAISLVISA